MLVALLLIGVGSLCGAEEVVSHRLLAADRGKVTILNAKGEIEWQVDIPFVIHDMQILPNKNILFLTDNTTIIEVTPKKQVVWKHVSRQKEGYTGAVEIHAFQRLKNGLTMVAESGNARIIEVDKEDNIVKTIPLTVNNPNSHRDTRRARKLDNGNYLVAHEGDGMVREYDGTGKVVWSYTLDLGGRERTPGHDGHGTEVFNALRLQNGNTLIAGGNNNRVLEVNREGKIVWSVDYNELPGIRLYWVTGLQVLPNGNIVIGNTHAGKENPQLIEITREKRVVWTLKNWEVFGDDLCAALLLDVKGKVIR
jgi:hypothetical protein